MKIEVFFCVIIFLFSVLCGLAWLDENETKERINLRKRTMVCPETVFFIRMTRVIL